MVFGLGEYLRESCEYDDVNICTIQPTKRYIHNAISSEMGAHRDRHGTNTIACEFGMRQKGTKLLADVSSAGN